MDTKPRTIYQWMHAVSERSLGIPSFQREYVWDQKKIARFLENIIVHPDRPVGVFLVLNTGGNFIFPPRYIDGSGNDADLNCPELLLDGQQRLTALWKFLKNEDDNYRYYVEFDERCKAKTIKYIKRDPDGKDKYSDCLGKEVEQSLFPACLLDPLKESTIIDRWIDKIHTAAPSISKKKIEEIDILIKDTRKIFEQATSSSRGSAKSAYKIPFFELTSVTEREAAIEIYKSLNTNSVRLSHYYLAVAQMEKQTEESLYEIAKELDNKVKSLRDREIESDETGELILKIFCLMNKKPPSGGAYKDLPFEELVLSKNKKAIFDGVEWAVGRLNRLIIWHGMQLPSAIPLRVLPALHRYYVKYISKGKSGERSRREGKADKLINRYLWHTFLTKRYTGARANDLLKEDFDALKLCFKSKLPSNCEKQVPIFADVRKITKLTKKDIKEAGWPKSKKIIARGILLACCQGGAKDPISGIPLDAHDLKNRELHHIFPKSRLAGSHVALNCLFISKGTNSEFTNHLPDTYLRRIYAFENGSGDLNENYIKTNLESHCISKSLSQTLIDAKNKTPSSKEDIKDTYCNFLEKRAKEVMKRIDKLLKDGRL